MKANNILYWSVLAAVGVVFLLLNIFTPVLHDDYAYAFYYAADSEVVRPTATPVTWGTLLPSMWHHYCCVNGRFTSHLVLQVFSGLVGKGVFNVCNTAVVLLLLHLLVRMSARSLSVPTLCAVLLAMFLFFPYPGQTMMWMTGAINYLWTATFSLAVLYYIEKNEQPSANLLRCALAFLAGVFVGWMQESVTIGVSGGLFLWFLFNRKRFRGTSVALAVGYWLGALLIIVSPGTFSRTGEIAVEMDAIQMVTSRLLGVSMAVVPYALPLIVVLIALVEGCRKKLCKPLMLPLAVLGVAFLFIYMLGMQEERIFFGLTVFSLWCLLRYVNELVSFSHKWSYVGLSVILFAASVPFAAKTMRVTQAYSDYTEALVAAVRRVPAKAVVELPPFELKDKWVMSLDLSPDIYNFHNRVRAFYFNKESLQYLPKALYDLKEISSIMAASEATEYIVAYCGVNRPVYELSKQGLWLIQFPDSLLPQSQAKVVYTLKDNLEPITSRQRMIRYMLNTLPERQKTLLAFTLTDANGAYLLFSKEFGVDEMVITDK